MEYQTTMAEKNATAVALFTAGTIAGELDDAGRQEEAWNRLRQEFPDHELAQVAALELARAAYKLSRYEEAVTLAGAATKSAELRGEAYVLMGEAELKLKRFGAALRALEAAAVGIGRPPQPIELARSALTKEERGQWPEALKRYERVATESPDATLARWAREAMLALGKSRFWHGDLEMALDVFRRANSPAPADPFQEAKFWEAEALFRLKRYAEAEAAYEAVAARAPSPLAPEAVYGLALLELELRRPEPAVRSFRRLLETWPENTLAADATFAIARTLAELGRYDEAVPFLAAFTTRYPRHEHAADARYLLKLTTAQSPETVQPLPGETWADAGRETISADATDFPFSRYLQDVERQIGERWAPHRRSVETRVVAVLEIGRGGDLRHAALERGSGDAAYDQDVLRAINRATPFPPLPGGFDQPLIRIHVGLTPPASTPMAGARGVVEGEPIPLDTKDPKFRAYFRTLRRQIKERWRYPREAADKNIQGQVVLEFGIAKDGQLDHVTVRSSSGADVLDDHAVMAVRLASPFPAVPDQIGPAGIPVLVIFEYVIGGAR
ncbi:MAG: hypothetical protein DMD82_13610 [Candidatus Rokuibacteriota bacterium]|nr:MAG: hypothetical protein DMD82_13610 [Candidatus Rokubacteria bacterium]